MKRLLNHDPITGIKTYFEYDADTGTRHIYKEQSVDVFVDFAKKIQDLQGRGLRGIKDSWLWFAMLPPIVQEKWLMEDHINTINPTQDDIKRMLKKLRDPEWQYLKTVTGRV